MNKLGPDGSTLLPIGNALTATGNSYQTAYLPRGQYKWVIVATVAGAYTEVSRVPLA